MFFQTLTNKCLTYQTKSIGIKKYKKSIIEDQLSNNYLFSCDPNTTTSDSTNLVRSHFRTKQFIQINVPTNHLHIFHDNNQIITK
jgi:hypothetical protein